MALNTTPGPDCESLCSVADADTYHTDRGNIAAWVTLDTTRKEQLLRDAYDFLYGSYWRVWPAGQVFGTLADVPDVVMRGARDSCARLALARLGGPLDAEVDPQVVEQTVGPITTKYAPTTNTTATVNAQPRRRTFPDVARLMAPYVTQVNPFVTPMVRA